MTLQDQCDLFNTSRDVGSEVLYYPGPGPRGGTPRKVVVSAPAQVMGRHSAVVYCQGMGAVAIEHLATTDGADIVTPTDRPQRPRRYTFTGARELEKSWSRDSAESQSGMGG